MLLKKSFLILFIMIFIPGTLFSAAVKKDKYIINPTVQNFDSFPNISTNLKWFISSVEHTSPQQDSGIIGYTRTGVKTSAPVICSPSLSSSIKNSLQNLLNYKRVNTTDVTAANFIVRISILNFSLSEISSVITQTMSAKIKLEVKLIDPMDANRVRQFAVESESSLTAMDTSKYAESITRDVIEDALKEIWKTINK